MHGKAGLGGARRGPAWHGKAIDVRVMEYCGFDSRTPEAAWPGKARPGTAWLGLAGLGRAWQGKARDSRCDGLIGGSTPPAPNLGTAGHGVARPGKAGLGKARALKRR